MPSLLSQYLIACGVSGKSTVLESSQYLVQLLAYIAGCTERRESERGGERARETHIVHHTDDMFQPPMVLMGPNRAPVVLMDPNSLSMQ
jgi:hypothetical protein